MTENSGSNEKKKKSESLNVIRFIVTYVVLMGAFFLLIGLEPVKQILDINGGYSNAIVILTAKILGIFGIYPDINGSLLIFPSISLNVEFGCNGLEAVMIYTVAVLTFPATWKNKLIGFLGGFLVIQILNLIRIVGLAYAGVYHRDLFELIHIYVAQGVMIAVALGAFVLYLTYLSHGHPKQQAAA